MNNLFLLVRVRGFLLSLYERVIKIYILCSRWWLYLSLSHSLALFLTRTQQRDPFFLSIVYLTSFTHSHLYTVETRSQGEKE